jgi:flagellar P-ring protein precursor FlgI
MTTTSTHRRLNAEDAPHGWVAISPYPRRERGPMGTSFLTLRGTLLAVCALFLAAYAASAQSTVPIRDLIIENHAAPVRLVGYGIVTGLTGTGDQTSSGRTSAHTVQSIASLLKRFDIAVPPQLLRTRNVAAVLVTAEVSPWLRAGGRFDVSVSSVGDARSLRGGVLWMTPLIAEVGGAPYATAQGAMVLDDPPQSGGRRRVMTIEGSGRVPSGGAMEIDLPRPGPVSSGRLLLRQPDIGTASRIAAVIDSAIGAGTASVEDPGSVRLAVADSNAAATLARVAELRVAPVRPARIIIDSRQGTVVAGGDLTIGPGVVSVGGVTVTIGESPADTAQQSESGAVAIRSGSKVQDLAAVLSAVRTPAHVIAQVFEALRQAGAISAEVVAR